MNFCDCPIYFLELSSELVQKPIVDDCFCTMAQGECNFLVFQEVGPTFGGVFFVLEMLSALFGFGISLVLNLPVG